MALPVPKLSSLRTLLTALALLFVGTAQALSPAFVPPEPGTLFSNYEPLEIELDFSMKELLRLKGTAPFPANKDLFVPGKITYVEASGVPVTLDLEVHLKGFSTLFSCEFPKLELKFKSANRAGTLFATTKTVDLNTHCRNQASKSETNKNGMLFNHREALIYRMADILGVPTYRARPLFVRYKNTGIPVVDEDPHLRQAFFLEDMGSFRKRLGLKEIKGVNDFSKTFEIASDPSKASQYIFTDVESIPKVDREDLTRIALFEQMIGNSDWFIKVSPTHKRFADASTAKGGKENLWNIKIVEDKEGHWIAFPQDFNFSRMAMGYPSLFSPDLEVFNASEKSSQTEIKNIFASKKDELYDSVSSLTEDPEGSSAIHKQLDLFFQNLGSDHAN